MKKRYGKKISKIEMICSCLVICGILFLTIGYSAFNTNMKIGDMNLTVRINADIRVTGISIESAGTVNATSNYEDYNVKGISVGVNMPSADSSISYKVQITNIGNVEMGIFQLTNLPENIAYTIENYNLQEPICVDSKCSLGIQKDIIITFKYKENGYNASNITYNLNPIFDFRSFHNVTYKNIDNSNTYPSKVIDGGTLSTNFPSDLSLTTMVDNTRLQSGVDYTLENGTFKLENITGDTVIFKDLYHYGLKGDYEVFTVPYSGYYLIELWGAQGGTQGTKSIGGKGAYTRGEIFLNAGESLYIYVGESPGSQTKSTFGGGAKGSDSTDTGGNSPGTMAGSGGGATDIRLANGSWDNFDSLKSRIMVAAGGGGNSNYGLTSNGGYGGALIGEDGKLSPWHSNVPLSRIESVPTGGTQTSGGLAGKHDLNSSDYSQSIDPTNGNFGKAGNSIYNTSGEISVAAGSGGGYYGGGGGTTSNSIITSGAGGSSFISGYDGCDAIAEGSNESNIIHTGQPNHYSGKVFLNPVMISGNANVPTYDGNGTMPGSNGDGHAKITYLPISSVKAYTATNLVKNSSFEVGNNNWIEMGFNWAIDTTIKLYGNNSAKRPASSQTNYNYILSDAIPTIANHKYYYFLHGYSSNVNQTFISDVTGKGGSGIVFSTNNQWARGSTIYVSGSTGEDRLAVNWGVTTADTYVDGVGFIDLTETFGPGNEPTKEWCDANIRYFDTTTTLYK